MVQGGTYIPLLNYRVSRVPESPPYPPTTVVIGEYDGWADPPDRPWNLISLANSALGLVYVHGPAIWDVDLSDVPPENTTVDGTVTTHLVPTEKLPLTRPLRAVGVPPDRVVDRPISFFVPSSMPVIAATTSPVTRVRTCPTAGSAATVTMRSRPGSNAVRIADSSGPEEMIGPTRATRMCGSRQAMQQSGGRNGRLV